MSGERVVNECQQLRQQERKIDEWQPISKQPGINRINICTRRIFLRLFVFFGKKATVAE